MPTFIRASRRSAPIVERCAAQPSINGPQTMPYQFKWSVLWTGDSGRWLAQGLLTTLEISALAWLLAVVLGIVSGALRTVPFRPLRALATFYVEFFRNVPLL